MIAWGLLPVVLGLVTLLLAVYGFITRSAGIYQSERQFWRVMLLSTGIAYVLSGVLALLVGTPLVVAVMASAMVPILIGMLEREDFVRPADEDGEDADDEPDDLAAGDADEAVWLEGGPADDMLDKTPVRSINDLL
jgi:hypothetical protein